MMDLISSNDMISIHAASDISIIQNSVKVRLVLRNTELAAYGIVIAWEKKNNILMLYSIEKHCVGVYFISWPLSLQFHLLIFDMLSNACQILSCIWFVEMMVRIPNNESTDCPHPNRMTAWNYTNFCINFMEQKL